MHHGAAGVDIDCKKTLATAAPVYAMGTPGMGVIVVGCKSPVRDWHFQTSVYQMNDLERQVLDESGQRREALVAEGRPTVGRVVSDAGSYPILPDPLVESIRQLNTPSKRLPKNQGHRMPPKHERAVDVRYRR